MSNYNLKKQSVFITVAALLFIVATVIMTRLSYQSFTVITYENQSCKIQKPYFSLSWIHSVDKTPWLEHYERSDQGFTLTHSIFKTFGAGVPHDGKVLPSDDGMIHYEMNQSLAEINWVIDQDVYSTIILPDHNSWEIYKNAQRYTEVQIRNQSLNFWQRLLIRNCHES